jgi:NAD(P)-dependent dehydrogenase (short-subunit alcohol dehydrogenase family)
MGSNRTVVIPGASTGIGRAAALRLDREGFRVFAGTMLQALLARFLPDRCRDARIVRFMKYPRTAGP